MDVIETLLRVYKQEGLAAEEFCEFVNRFGDSRLKQELNSGELRSHLTTIRRFIGTWPLKPNEPNTRQDVERS